MGRRTANDSSKSWGSILSFRHSWARSALSSSNSLGSADIQGEGKKKKLNASSSFEDEEHLLGILVSLFTNLESDTPARIRLIAKFVENNYEKVERLLEMREVAESRLKPVDKDIMRERKVMEANREEIDEDIEGEWYLRRSEAGMSALQNADYVLGWICMEDDGVS